MFVKRVLQWLSNARQWSWQTWKEKQLQGWHILTFSRVLKNTGYYSSHNANHRIIPDTSYFPCKGSFKLCVHNVKLCYNKSLKNIKSLLKSCWPEWHHLGQIWVSYFNLYSGISRKYIIVRWKCTPVHPHTYTNTHKWLKSTVQSQKVTEGSMSKLLSRFIHLKERGLRWIRFK